jgi:hypothetical protein
MVGQRIGNLTSTILIYGAIFYAVILAASHYFWPMPKDKPNITESKNPYWKSQGRTYTPEEMDAAFKNAYNNCTRPKD